MLIVIGRIYKIYCSEVSVVNNAYYPLPTKSGYPINNT